MTVIMDTAPSEPDLEGNVDTSSIVEQCLSLLKHKDDTSRFVGLAMLLSVYNHIQDVKVLERCTKALNPTFLDRLLRAGRFWSPKDG